MLKPSVTSHDTVLALSYATVITDATASFAAFPSPVDAEGIFVKFPLASKRLKEPNQFYCTHPIPPYHSRSHRLCNNHRACPDLLSYPRFYLTLDYSFRLLSLNRTASQV
jgi:hypothetical protein